MQSQHTEINSALENYQTGMKFYLLSNRSEALIHMLNAAKSGYPPAFLRLADLYRSDWLNDEKEAQFWVKKAQEHRRWFEQEAATGSAVALNDLAILCTNLNELDMSIKLCQQAAQKGYNFSHLNLGIAYLCGRGLPKNTALGLKELNKATKEGPGQLHTLYYLGMLYLGITKIPEIKVDLKSGREYLERAAAKGFIDAMNMLGRILYEGISSAENKDASLAENKDSANAYLRDAAVLGDPRSQHLLGKRCRESGNMKQAESWLIQAIEQNYTPAFWEIGLLYYQQQIKSGFPLETNLLSKAKILLRAAMIREKSLHTSPALVIYNNICILEGSYREALTVLIVSIAENVMKAKCQLSIAFMSGEAGLEKNLEIAFKLFQSAYQQSSLAALNFLTISTKTCIQGFESIEKKPALHTFEALAFYAAVAIKKRQKVSDVVQGLFFCTRKMADMGEPDARKHLEVLANDPVFKFYEFNEDIYKSLAEENNKSGLLTLAEQQHVLFSYQTAMKLYFFGNVIEALPSFIQAATSGYPPAFLRLAELYQSEHFKNNKAFIFWKNKALHARPWFEAQAETGKAEALHDLGVLCALNKEREASHNYYEQAVEKGLNVAFLNLALSHLSTNPVAAIMLLRKATKADFGKLHVLYNLGLIHLGLMNTPEIHVNHTLGLTYLQDAAQQGFIPAQYKLWELLYNGQILPENKPLGMQCLIKSANQGDLLSLYQLGCIYKKIGKITLAENCFKGAFSKKYLKGYTQQGNIETELLVHYMTTESFKEALLSLSDEKTKDHGDAKCYLTMYLLYGETGFEKNHEKAFEIFHSAFEKAPEPTLNFITRLVKDTLLKLMDQKMLNQCLSGFFNKQSVYAKEITGSQQKMLDLRQGLYFCIKKVAELGEPLAQQHLEILDTDSLLQFSDYSTNTNTPAVAAGNRFGLFESRESESVDPQNPGSDNKLVIN